MEPAGWNTGRCKGDYVAVTEFFQNLSERAARLLADGAPLILYGPWLSGEVTTVPSNLAFDADLKRRDPNWGLRRVEDFAEAARARNLELVETKYMSANNMMLLFRKHAPAR